MKNKIGLILFLLMLLAIEIIMVMGTISLFAKGEIIFAIIGMYGALFYAWLTIDAIKKLIDSFKQDGGQNDE